MQHQSVSEMWHYHSSYNERVAHPQHEVECWLFWWNISFSNDLIIHGILWLLQSIRFDEVLVDDWVNILICHCSPTHFQQLFWSLCLLFVQYMQELVMKFTRDMVGARYTVSHWQRIIIDDGIHLWYDNYWFYVWNN